MQPWARTRAAPGGLPGPESVTLRSPGAGAILLTLDQAGWQMSAKLAVPGNITLLPLPPRSPKLTPVENPGSGPGQVQNPEAGRRLPLQFG